MARIFRVLTICKISNHCLQFPAASIRTDSRTMGIQGLTKLLGDYAPGSMKENEIKNYFGEMMEVLIENLFSQLSPTLFSCQIIFSGYNDYSIKLSLCEKMQIVML